MANTLSVGALAAACDGIVDTIESGSSDAAGDIEIYTSGFATKLAELTFSNPAFGDASGGIATAAAITGDSSAQGTGTAALYRVRNLDNSTIWDGTISLLAGNGDLKFDTLVISQGDAVGITSGTVTVENP